MSIPQVVFDRLRDLVDDRVYPSIFPQNNPNPAWPAIRYTLVGFDVAGSLCGTNDEETDDVRVQIDIVTVTYPGMRALKYLVINALQDTDPPCSRQPGGFETYDSETRTHRAVLEYLFQQSSVEAPEVVSAPQIVGTPQVGEVLTVLGGEYSE